MSAIIQRNKTERALRIPPPSVLQCELSQHYDTISQSIVTLSSYSDSRAAEHSCPLLFFFECTHLPPRFPGWLAPGGHQSGLHPCNFVISRMLYERRLTACNLGIRSFYSAQFSEDPSRWSHAPTVHLFWLPSGIPRHGSTTVPHLVICIRGCHTIAAVDIHVQVCV